jgi:hypothetical protein
MFLNACEGQDLAEIQGERQHGPHLESSLEENLTIVRSLETVVAQMADVRKVRSS